MTWIIVAQCDTGITERLKHLHTHTLEYICSPKLHCITAHTNINQASGMYKCSTVTYFGRNWGKGTSVIGHYRIDYQSWDDYI